MTEVVSYNANCHCGRFRYRIDLPKIETATICSCFLCTKMGYMWLSVNADAVTVTRGGDAELTKYKSAVLEHEFCTYCGTGIRGRHSGGPLKEKLLINARAILELNPYNISSSDCETEDLSAIAQSGFSAPAVIEDDSPTTYETASCHCGNIKATLLIPLSTLEVKEDNCSICVRNAWTGIYPTRDQVIIQGKENSRDYLLGRGWSGAPFCTTCGVHVFGNLHGPPQQFLDELPPEKLEKFMVIMRRNMDIQSLNVRTFDNIEFASLQVQKSDEGTEGYTLSD